MDKLSNESVIINIKKFKTDINKHFHVQEMILFGSRARDDWLYTSDVDLIIVSEDFRGINFLDRIRRIALMWDDDLRLEPICYTPEEFEEKKRQIGIVREAVRYGITI